MQKYINTIVKKALDEDLKPHGDITTNLIRFKNKKTKAQIVAKQNGVIAGLDFCRAAFKLVGKETIFISKVKDGSKVKKNNLEKILDCLENDTNEIILDNKTIEAARKSVIRMTEIGR